MEEDVRAIPRVVEKREEIRVKLKLVDEFNNAIIKQELIEQCTKRRAPIKERYQS